MASVFSPGFSHGQSFQALYYFYYRFFIYPVFSPQAFLMVSAFSQAFLHGQFVQALCFFIDFSGFYHGQFLGPLFFLDFSGFSHGKFFTPRILFRFFICPVFFPQAFLMTTNFSGPLFFV